MKNRSTDTQQLHISVIIFKPLAHNHSFIAHKHDTHTYLQLHSTQQSPHHTHHTKNSLMEYSYMSLKINAQEQHRQNAHCVGNFPQSKIKTHRDDFSPPPHTKWRNSHFLNQMHLNTFMRFQGILREKENMYENRWQYMNSKSSSNFSRDKNRAYANANFRANIFTADLLCKTISLSMRILNINYTRTKLQNTITMANKYCCTVTVALQIR